MSDEARPVLMSLDLADMLGLGRDQWVQPDGLTVVVRLTEQELLGFGGSRVDWGEPDIHGWYTPTIYSSVPTPLP